MPSETSDEALMVAYVAGQQPAFQELFQRYYGPLFAVMRRTVVKPEDARELVQQTFLQFHRARLDFRPGAKVKPWLWTIALNLRREHGRRGFRRPETELEEEPKHEGPATPAAAKRLQHRRDLAVAMEQLTPRQREIVELHWFDGIPFPEIAEMLGMNVGAVKVDAHRAYQRMRQALGGEP